jgi:hypothetical protein
MRVTSRSVRLVAALLSGVLTLLLGTLIGAPRPAAAPSSAPVETATPAPVAPATAAPIAVAPVPTRAWFARDGLPPVAAEVSGSPARDDRPETRIDNRISALWGARNAPAGAFNVFAGAGRQGGSGTLGVSLQVSGDLVTVTFDLGGRGWGVSSAAETTALIQQLVYTITEEPGIRRALIKEAGKTRLELGSAIIDRPLPREDVFVYAAPADAGPMKGLGALDGPTRRASATWSVEQVGPALTRFVIALDQQRVTPMLYHPDFDVTLRAPTPADPPTAKSMLEIRVYQTIDAKAGSLLPIGGGGVQSVRITTGAHPGDPTIYMLALDDARPWRTALAFEPVRIIVDVGGMPGTIHGQNAVYAPRPNETVGRSFTIAGVQHNFEAHVDIRVRDANGRVVLQSAATGTNCCDPGGTFEKRLDLPEGVSGQVTLDVFEGSQQDGSVTKLIQIPLTVR